jgi:hypothetical protein
VISLISQSCKVCHAQELPNLPPLSSADLSLKDNPAAPGSLAMILDMAVETDNTKSTEVHSVRIKVFTEAGRKYANLEIPYSEKLARVEEIRARTITLDAKVHEFDGQIFDREVVKSRKLKMNTKVLYLPDVQAGTIIDYSYKLRFKEGVPNAFRNSGSQFYFRSFVYPAANWTLQRNLFVRHGSFFLRPVKGANIREFEIPLPGKAAPVAQNAPSHIYSFDPVAQGFSFPVRFQSDGTITLQVDNIPAYEDEDFSLPEESLKARVDLYYAGGFTDPERFWIDVGERLADVYEPFMDKPKAMQREIAQLFSPGDSDEVKLGKIYTRVQSIRQPELEGSKSEKQLKQENLNENKSVDDVLTRGYAFGHQANLLFVALARAAGFRAFPILVTSRQTGVFMRTLPDEGQLNAMVVVVAKAGQTTHFLDPESPFCPFGLLPWYESGTQGVMVARGGVQIGGVPYIEARDALTQLDADLQLDAQGSVRGSVQVDFQGLEALVWREWGEFKDKVERQQALDDYLKAKSLPGASVKLLSSRGWDTSAGALHAEYSVELPEIASSTGKRLLLSLGVFHANSKNPLDSARRVHPVVFQHPYQTEESVRIKLPPELSVDALPGPYISDQKAAYFEISTRKVNGGTTVHRLLRVAESRFDLADYTNLRLFFDRTLYGDAQQIVLRKIDAEASR